MTLHFVSAHRMSSNVAMTPMKIVIDLMREKSNENTSRFSRKIAMKVLPSTVEPSAPSCMPTPSHDNRKNNVAVTKVG